MVAMATSLSTSGSPSNTWFLRPIQAHNPNGISIGSAIFAQVTGECPTLYNGTPLSPRNCPFPWGIWTPANTWFLEPTRVLNPNGISIGGAVFAGLTSVTDRQTDHATRSTTIGRTYVGLRSIAMRPNKELQELIRRWDSERELLRSAPGSYPNSLK